MCVRAQPSLSDALLNRPSLLGGSPSQQVNLAAVV